MAPLLANCNVRALSRGRAAVAASARKEDQARAALGQADGAAKLGSISPFCTAKLPRLVSVPLPAMAPVVSTTAHVPLLAPMSSVPPLTVGAAAAGEGRANGQRARQAVVGPAIGVRAVEDQRIGAELRQAEAAGAVYW